jgi:molybdopterin biosynthesis enzyme
MLFALPGNPVSSFVTANLLLPLAIKTLLDRQYHYGAKLAWPVYINAEMHPKILKTDKFRPEYHRCMVLQSSEDGKYHAISTGSN